MNDWDFNNQCIEGFKIKSQKIITKNDIINICELLNQEEFYKNICTFEPEPISEGGIIFKFINSPIEWYKSMRIYFAKEYSGGDLGIVKKDVMNEWKNNNDIIMNEKNIIKTYLKSFRNAPRFTQDELKIWESCFNKVGFIRVGKYPSKKNLK